MIGLIKVASFLLDRQLMHLEEEFLKEGGLRERMTLARINERNKRNKGHT
jgi:four helix bundle suffix protein